MVTVRKTSLYPRGWRPFFMMTCDYKWSAGLSWRGSAYFDDTGRHARFVRYVRLVHTTSGYEGEFGQKKQNLCQNVGNWGRKPPTRNKLLHFKNLINITTGESGPLSLLGVRVYTLHQ